MSDQRTLNYQETNRNAWNTKTHEHVDSKFYDLEGFKAGNTSLKEIELALLGDVTGKSILHLQCHFGQDTLSLSRMGAKTTGIDLSDTAIEQAKKLNTELGLSAEFICCDVYDLPHHLNKQFDLVFTSYGTIGWLPDLDKWASLVSQFLKPDGEFIFVEFHPVVWMFDATFEKVEYRYFKTDPIVETETGTYAQKDADIEVKTISWNHGLGEVFTSLLNHNLSIQSFQEYDFSPYDCFSGLVEEEPGRYRTKKHGNYLPMAYSIKAKKQ